MQEKQTDQSSKMLYVLGQNITIILSSILATLAVEFQQTQHIQSFSSTPGPPADNSHLPTVPPSAHT
jgi:hypothetical protein